MTCDVRRVTCDVLHDQVIVLSVGRVVEQGKPSHNVAPLHSAAVACDMMPVAGDPRLLAAEEGTAFALLLKAVDGAA